GPHDPVGGRARPTGRGRAHPPRGQHEQHQGHQAVMLVRRARLRRPVYLEGYPAWGRRAILWYDSLTDWQRIRYVLIVMAFLLACLGYLLGLGSTLLLQHVEVEEEALAAQRLLT